MSSCVLTVCSCKLDRGFPSPLFFLDYLPLGFFFGLTSHRLSRPLILVQMALLIVVLFVRDFEFRCRFLRILPFPVLTPILSTRMGVRPMLVSRIGLCLEGFSKILVVAPCHTAKSSRYELLIPESVWIDNIVLERERS